MYLTDFEISLTREENLPWTDIRITLLKSVPIPLEARHKYSPESDFCTSSMKRVPFSKM